MKEKPPDRPREMRIRSFAEGDTVTLIELWKRCGLLRPWNDPAKDIARKVAQQPDGLFVGEIEQVMVATVMAGYEGHRGWINYLAVDPEYRRRGLGRKILTHAQQHLASLGCPKVNLQVRIENDAAIAFYKAAGFQVDEVTSLGKRLIEEGEQHVSVDRS